MNLKKKKDIRVKETCIFSTAECHANVPAFYMLYKLRKS